MVNGRPTKLTPEVQEQLVETLRGGNYLETACALAGVSRVTVRNWLRRGARQKRGPYRDFLNAIKKAMAEAEANDVKVIKEAADKWWQAAAWRLERKHWKRWGRKDKVQQELTGRDGKAIEIKAVDYRVAIAALAPRSVEDSGASGEDQGDVHG